MDVGMHIYAFQNYRKEDKIMVLKGKSIVF